MRYLIILLLVCGCTITPETLDTTGTVLTTAGEVVGSTVPGPAGGIAKVILIGIGGVLTTLAGQKVFQKKSKSL